MGVLRKPRALSRNWPFSGGSFARVLKGCAVISANVGSVHWRRWDENRSAECDVICGARYRRAEEFFGKGHSLLEFRDGSSSVGDEMKFVIVLGKVFFFALISIEQMKATWAYIFREFLYAKF